MDIDDTPDVQEPGSLRFLRILVTVLTVVMIVGFLVLIGFLVTRFPGMSSSVPLPDQLELPAGATAVAFTQGSDWMAVVTDGDQIVIYNMDGSLRQTIEVDPGG